MQSRTWFLQARTRMSKTASGTPVLILILRHALEDADANKGADYADLFIHLMLLQHKADPNARGAAGAPALFMAASTGCAEFTKVLLKFGAKADLASPEGFTPLMGAALVRDDAAARMLIQRGANVNAKTKDGMTPLLSSAIPNTDAKVLHRDPLKVFRLLLEHGADIHYSRSGRFQCADGRHPCRRAGNGAHSSDEGSQNGSPG